VECIKFSPNCSIDGFVVIPAASSLTTAPIDLDMSGTTSFCRSAVDAVNIETNINFDTGTVVIKLFGPKKGLIQETIASDAPFFLYNATSTIQLVPATYMVQALAIVVGKGQVSHKQTTFTVKDC
jgi:hypothetical protein